MKSLEEILRAKAKSGDLNEISVGFHNGVWSASYRGVAHADHRMTSRDDVVEALLDALTGKKTAPVARGTESTTTAPVRAAAKPAARKPKKPTPAPKVVPENDVFGDLM